MALAKIIKMNFAFSLLLSIAFANQVAAKNNSIINCYLKEITIIDSSGNKEELAEEHFKNIKVLKGIPASAISPAMQFISSSLGVKCDYCHYQNNEKELDFDSDKKEEKKTAREMITMVNEINKKFFEGHNEVSCATCHKGSTFPSKRPPVSSVSLSEIVTSKELADAETVIENYYEKIDSQNILSTLKTVSFEGNINFGKNSIAPFTVIEKLPNKFLRTITINNSHKRISAYDGNTVWLAQDTNIHIQIGAKAAFILNETPLFWNKNFFSDNFDRIKSIGTTINSDSDFIVLKANSKDKYSTQLFYFNRKSGLLMKRIVFNKTVLGELPEEYEYSDYKKTEDIYFPGKITVSKWNQNYTITFDKIEINTDADDNLFSPFNY